MALRASGRSSQKVATWPSCWMLRTSEFIGQPYGPGLPAAPGEPAPLSDRAEESQVEPGKISATRSDSPTPRQNRLEQSRLVQRGLLTDEEPNPLTFTADASARLSGPDWLARRRNAAWDRFVSASLPTEDDELWKYSDVGQLDLDSFAPLDFEESNSSGKEDLIARARRVASFAGEWSALVVTVDGALLCIEQGADGPVGRDDEGAVGVHSASADEVPEPVAVARDAIDDLHSAFVPDVVQVRIKAKAHVERPVVIVHLVTRGPAPPPTGISDRRPAPERRRNWRPPASPTCTYTSASPLRRAWSRSSQVRPACRRASATTRSGRFQPGS